jgi:hypothetical protein
MNADDIAQNAVFTSAFELPGMGGRAKFVKVTLTHITPTESFIRWVKGEVSTMDQVIDNLVVRRNFMIKDGNQQEVYDRLLADTRIKPMRVLLELLRICNIPRHRAEYLLKSEALRSLDRSLGQIVAVHLFEVCTKTVAGVRQSYPIHFSDIESRMRVFVRDTGAAANFNRHSARLCVTLGAGSGAMNFEIPMQLLEPKEKIESKRQTLIERKTELALQQAAKFDPPRDVRMVEVQLVLTIQPGKEGEARSTSVSNLEERLIYSLGAVAEAIVGIHCQGMANIEWTLLATNPPAYG